MRLVSWSAQDLARRMDEVLAVFGEAMSYDKQALEVRRPSLEDVYIALTGRPQEEDGAEAGSP